MPIVGIALGVAVFVMEVSSVRYWNMFAGRAEEIERTVTDLRLMTRWRPAKRMFSATSATYLIYLGVSPLWIVVFLWGS